jgi:hypothetical protein
MHYNYSTLQQAFNLLYDQWAALSANHTNFDKCRLFACQVIGYLQRSLPAIDRFVFSRAFSDGKRTLEFKYARGSFPNNYSGGDRAVAGLGFDHLIFGSAAARFTTGITITDPSISSYADFEISLQTKTSNLRPYAAAPNSNVRLCDTGSESGTSLLM